MTRAKGTAGTAALCRCFAAILPSQPLFLLFLRFGFPLLLAGCFTADFGHPFSRVHGAAAFGRTAAAGGRVIVVVEVVVPDEFFAGGDVADGEDPDAAFNFVDLAGGIARMIQGSAQAVAVDHGFAIVQSIEISAGDAFVAAVGFLGGNSLAVVLDHAS